MHITATDSVFVYVCIETAVFCEFSHAILWFSYLQHCGIEIGSQCAMQCGILNSWCTQRMSTGIEKITRLQTKALISKSIE